MQGLRTVIYRVPDIEQAKKWYAQAFDTPAYFDEPYYVGFNIGGYELGLQPEEGDSEEKGANVVAYWGVANLKEAFERLLSLGAEAHEHPMDVGSGIVTATLKDPYGNVIGLIFNPHFQLES